VVEYRNARDSREHLEEMLRVSNGSRRVPVIVENGAVTIGFEGGT
jgi:glutaredoxin